MRLGRTPAGPPFFRYHVTTSAPGTPPTSFQHADGYVVWRLMRLMIKKRGRNLRAVQVWQWNDEWFNGHSLYRPRGTTPKHSAGPVPDGRQPGVTAGDEFGIAGTPYMRPREHETGKTRYG